MLSLSNELYRRVPVSFELSRPWLIDPAYRTQLQRFNQQSLSLYKKSEGFNKGKLLQIKASQRDYPFISVVSNDVLPGPFLKKDEWDDRRKSIDLWLPTELHISENLLGYSSSRHVSLEAAQIKGVGASRLASSEDYYHGWGGFPARDCLRSLISDYFVERRSQLGTLKTRAVLIFDSQPLGFPLALAIRENSGFRLSQIRKGVTTAKDARLVRESIFRFHGTRNLKNAFFNIVDNLILMNQTGLFPRSNSPQNFIMDGRQVDTESIDVLSTPSPVTFIEMQFSSRTQLFPNPGFESLKGNLKVNRTWISQFIDDVFSYITAFSAISDSGFLSDHQALIKECVQRLKLANKDRFMTLNSVKPGQILTRSALRNLISAAELHVWDEALARDQKSVQILFGAGQEHPRHFGLSLLKNFDWKYFPKNLSDESAAIARWSEMQEELSQFT